MRYFSSRGADVLNSDYGNAVTFTVAVKKEEEVCFDSDLVNAVNGKVTIKKLREYYFPFAI